MLFTLALLACGEPPPVVELVNPNNGIAGATVKIIGSEFRDGTTATLGGAPMTDLNVRGATLMEATVPAEAPAGAADLVVTSPEGQVVTLPGGFTVAAPADDGEPCAGPFTAYSQLALGRDLVIIDKHYHDPPDKRDTLRINVRDVAGIEFESVRMDDGEVCTAIFMRLKGGGRELFDDDTEEDLLPRAQQMANAMQKPIDVVRTAEPLPEEGEGGAAE